MLGVLEAERAVCQLGWVRQLEGALGGRGAALPGHQRAAEDASDLIHCEVPDGVNGHLRQGRCTVTGWKCLAGSASPMA